MAGTGEKFSTFCEVLSSTFFVDMDEQCNMLRISRIRKSTVRDVPEKLGSAGIEQLDV